MGQGNQTTSRFSGISADNAQPALCGPNLTLVTSRFQLREPVDPAPQDWRDGLAGLLDWLRIDAEFVPATRTRRLPRIADWATSSNSASERCAPVFAPWLGWSPAAFQHGGIPGLPQAQFVTGYLLDHGRGLAGPNGGIDLALISPHPSVCMVEQAGDAPLPRPAVLKAMIRAAKSEGREKLAIILHARQRNAVARHLLAADRELTREGLAIEILTIEEALRPLAAGRAPWDAIIVMPDLRSIVFTLLNQTSGVNGPWPMLWYGGERGSELSLITCEAAGEGATRPALDAPTLIHALALCLHHAGSRQAARRLHEGWSRLRDSGVTTAGRGESAPYVTQVKDRDFLDMLCSASAPSQRPVRRWRALGDAERAGPGSVSAGLRVVASTSPVSPR